MSEIQNAADMLHRHINELQRTGPIEIQEAQRLRDELRILCDDLEHHYEEM